MAGARSGSACRCASFWPAPLRPVLDRCKRSIWDTTFAAAATAVHLTSFADYGLPILILLALKDSRLCTVREISQTYGLSENHLLKIVQALARLGYVHPLRGGTGAFGWPWSLARFSWGEWSASWSRAGLWSSAWMGGGAPVAESSGLRPRCLFPPT